MVSKVKGPIKVAGNSYYMPATSNAGLFKGYVIDPGSVGYDDLCRDDVHSVLITHGHNDHFRHAHEFREKGARVIASKDDALLVRNPEVNVRGLFSWARPPAEMITPYFQGDACEVDLYVEDWLDSSIKSVWLPGHTLGEYGFITEDAVLYSGDSLYSKEIWSKYKLPYSIDPELCRESLIKIKGLDFDYVVPGHGDPMERDDALKAADYHLEQLDRVDEIILGLIEEPVSTESLVTRFSYKLDLYKSLNNYWLTLVMLKGHLSSLNHKGKVAYRLENYCMYWYKV
ncbi:Zn-dependent hydrolase, including glyoxylase [Methanocella conradii HZ254]|uniref:Zn-dependent hydrolase, including glyoxylase n=1 Tax=Methanocella conradii (strain DSM 24694 / JCM 17849 / CGMCC 1.5162 / HZ254) TaxID=1041930 RepID=H8I5E1_METCZ|nr:MBL fold metallo-hydrolase [Methanocella conradii]AFC98835.1 Zn-dependent hydrolase, including glyoxylase [Methanocella conradii HZ254]MDI6897167.1 MBL fold metallo-hydrolase [Methanocella conradii]